VGLKTQDGFTNCWQDRAPRNIKIINDAINFVWSHMTQPPKIRSLVFDAYGTLFDVHSIVTTCERLFPGKGTALSQTWRTKQLEYTWLRNSIQRHVDFNQVTQDALRVACEALTLAYTDAALNELNLAYRTLQPFADARSALATLNAAQQKPKLAILSNGAPDMLNAVVKHNGFDTLLDYVLSVEEVGVFKPDPRVYQLAVDRLGIAKNEIGFVSSNGWDAAGAKAFGLNVFWINRSGAPVERLGVTPDYVVKSLDEVAEILMKSNFAHSV
jgi:2-haloacid dehalogenase